MKTAIVFFSKHHENTKKLVCAIKEANPDVKLIDLSLTRVTELKEYDRIGVASGIFYGKMAGPLMEYLKKYLPGDKGVFVLYTCGTKSDKYTREIKEFVREKHCAYMGEYGCLGFDTFGPFKLVGGIAKGHPTEEEINGAVHFYDTLI